MNQPGQLTKFGVLVRQGIQQGGIAGAQAVDQTVQRPAHPMQQRDRQAGQQQHVIQNDPPRFGRFQDQHSDREQGDRQDQHPEDAKPDRTGRRFHDEIPRREVVAQAGCGR